ncbi:hypothetical protein SLEP1_g26655 [Rubroshorea leprosula]|uniref:DUF1771 domain-containing protein n=1 Tax=Rubroshorea leprosula TaxID=152421 RepID=A0AAV5JX15_9ROSI|nr:hypothetical protein SLEP1_g26655 [Rubroshorea leprosula]
MATDHEIEMQNLRQLLQVFGSRFSLKEIASAYCKSEGNIDMASDILCSTVGSSFSTIAGTSEDKMAGASSSTMSLEFSSGLENSSAVSSELSSDHVLGNSCYAEGNTTPRALKSKKCYASVGNVSTMIGKDYVRTRPLTKVSSETTKPMKLDSKEFPVLEIRKEEASSTMTTVNVTPYLDIEEFLLNMLEGGFQLDKSVIQEVLGSSGYDVQKSVDKLVDLSASSLEKYDDVVGISADQFSNSLELKGSISMVMACCSSQIRSTVLVVFLFFSQVWTLTANELCFSFTFFLSKFISSSWRNVLWRDPVQNKDNNYAQILLKGIEEASSIAKQPVAPPKIDNLQKEVLDALFTFPKRSEEESRKISVVDRSMAFNNLVMKRPGDTTKSRTAAANNQKSSVDEDEDDENSFDVLRQAVKEYWNTMREYYKAAADAFAKGDKAQAERLLEKGRFFNKKAREADEKSAEKIIEDRSRDDETMSLDLHNLDAREALRVLRVHLTSISGIPTITYLRLIVGTDDKDPKFRGRKRLV